MIVSPLKTILFFTLVGPLFGLLGVVAQDVRTFGTVSPAILLLVSYGFGSAPAFATGVAAWLLRNKLGWFSGSLACGAVGALASVVLWLVVRHGTLPIESLVRLGMLPGGLAGLICGLIYFWPPNNSFKPTPLRGVGKAS